MIYTFKELLEKLECEHDEQCFYRGQVELFDSPLWPSMYRKLIHIFVKMPPNGLERMYNRGNCFSFSSNMLVPSVSPEDAKRRETKRLVMAYARNALGYCLSEAMFQQAGWDSEGLDVSTDLNVALFFATHRYMDKKYHNANTSDVHVMYRWRIPNEEWSLERLNKVDYNNCPALFPSQKILDLFEECDTIEEFEESINSYKKAIHWGADFYGPEIQGNRPFELIRIPREWKKKSRIVRQKAALLFPDVIPYEEFTKHYNFTNESWLNVASYGGRFLEDLSTAFNCDTFLFKMEDDDFQYINVPTESVYIDDDISHRFLNGWMSSFHQNPYGTINVMFPIDNNYLGQLDAEMNFSEDRFKNHESDLNG